MTPSVSFASATAARELLAAACRKRPERWRTVSAPAPSRRYDWALPEEGRWGQCATGGDGGWVGEAPPAGAVILEWLPAPAQSVALRRVA